MENFGRGTSLRTILFLLFCFLPAILTTSAFAENEKAAKDDIGGTMKIQTDVAGEEAVQDDDGDEEKPEKGNKTQAEKDGNKAKDDKEDEDIFGGDQELGQEVEVNPELMGDFAKMAKVGRLDKDQQTQLLKIQKERELELEKWDQKWNPKIDKAQDLINKTDNKHKRAKLERQLENLKKNRERIEERENLKAFRVFNQKQIVAWNSEQLASEVENEFADLELDDTQLGKMKVLCRKIAAKVKGKRDISSQKHLSRLAVKESISLLSKDQKREYLRHKAEQKRNEAREQEKDKNDDDKQSKTRRGRSNR